MAAIPCIEAILEASEGQMDRQQAGRLLRTLGDKVNARMALTGEARQIAAMAVHEEALARESFRAALAKRNALRDAAIADSWVEMVKGLNTGRKMLADRFTDLVGQKYSLLRAMQAQAQGRFAADLEAGGVGQWFRDMTPTQAKEVTVALHDAQAGRASTVSPEARKLADIFYAIQKENVGLMNKEGADVKLAEGRGFMQTHDIAKLRGFSDKATAKDWWKNLIRNGVNVNWEKTLEGAESRDIDEFLNRFFENIYNKVHNSNEGNIHPEDFKPGGSLANKASAARVLWFADADSAWKYQGEMGIHKQDVRRLMQAEINAAERTIVMLRTFGTRPDEVMGGVVRDLEAHINNGDFPDSSRQIENLRHKKVANALHLLDGRADSTVNPTLQAWTDNLKAFAVMSKMGGASITAFFGDRPHMITHMHHMGASAAELAALQFDTIKVNTPEGKALLDRLGMQGEAMSHAIKEWWMDMRTNRYAQAATQKMLDWTGLTRVTESHRASSAKYLAFLWGRDANTPFSELPHRRKFQLEKYQIDETEWNLVRHQVYDVDDYKALSPDLAHHIPDADVDRALGLANPSGTARERWRNELEAKMTTYLRQNVDASMAQPGFGERMALTAYGTPRGHGIREGLELITLLKAFPFSAFNRTRERAREMGGGIKPMAVQVAALVAQSIFAGYAIMTVKDLLGGRTRRKLVDDDGNINWSVIQASMLRGGGLGIYGDFLFGEYDRRYRTALGSMAGPVLGQLDPIFAMATKAKNLLKGDVDENAESLGYDALRFGQENLPFVNMFYLKPILDHFIFWHLKEGLSPGVFRRTQQNVEDNNYQEFWIEPSL